MNNEQIFIKLEKLFRAIFDVEELYYFMLYRPFKINGNNDDFEFSRVLEYNDTHITKFSSYLETNYSEYGIIVRSPLKVINTTKQLECDETLSIDMMLTYGDYNRLRLFFLKSTLKNIEYDATSITDFNINDSELLFKSNIYLDFEDIDGTEDITKQIYSVRVLSEMILEKSVDLLLQQIYDHKYNENDFN